MKAGRYIFYYSEKEDDYEKLYRSLPLEQHRIQLVNIRDLTLPEDVDSAFLLGSHILTDPMMLRVLNGSRIWISNDLAEIKTGKVSKQAILEQLEKFFCLDVLNEVTDISPVIEKFEKAGVKFMIPASEKPLVIPDDITYSELRAFLQMARYLGFYNIEFTK